MSTLDIFSVLESKDPVVEPTDEQIDEELDAMYLSVYEHLGANDEKALQTLKILRSSDVMYEVGIECLYLEGLMLALGRGCMLNTKKAYDRFLEAYELGSVHNAGCGMKASGVKSAAKIFVLLNSVNPSTKELNEKFVVESSSYLLTIAKDIVDSTEGLEKEFIEKYISEHDVKDVEESPDDVEESPEDVKDAVV